MFAQFTILVKISNRIDQVAKLCLLLDLKRSDDLLTSRGFLGPARTSRRLEESSK